MSKGIPPMKHTRPITHKPSPAQLENISDEAAILDFVLSVVAFFGIFAKG